MSETGFLRSGSRLVVALVFALLAAVTIVRSVIAEGGVFDERGAEVWPGHPNVLSSTILADIGRAAAQGREPDPGTLADVQSLAVREPLSPVPLLVRAALDIRRGDYRRAEESLAEARMRDPRFPAARFLLADLYLRTGRPALAMREMAVLYRLVPQASEPLAPALAGFASTTRSQKDIEAILDSYPELGPAVLVQMSADPRNDRMLVALAGRPALRKGPKLWQRNLLDGLVGRGAYGAAYAIWARLSGVQGDPSRLFNPSFAAIDAPPPFNWDLAAGTGGLAEGQNGALQLLYYGREDLILAKQLLQLRPGRYRLSMAVARSDGDPQSLRWQVKCLPEADRQLLDLPLAPRAGSRVEGEFTVPAGGCAAQALALTARAKEFPERAEFRVSDLRLDSFGAK